MQPIRQGDVILRPITEIQGKKLYHLILAQGEVTGHAHRISQGQAELYEKDGILYLKVLSPTALLTHEEHHQVSIPHGNWLVRIQREYDSLERAKTNIFQPQKKTPSSQPPLKSMTLEKLSKFQEQVRENWRYLKD